ncbi:caspase-7-like [Saccostrea cucullata]|uniref:caspase-7-like n=1 Tax=Saccostrea cuccullata TaxID=36930 RepID=UPI002ED2046B
MSEGRYALKKKSGKVLIVINQNYHRKHFGENDVPDIKCQRCRKYHIRKDEWDGDLKSERITKEDADITELVDIFKALGFTDIHGGTDRFVERNKSKKEMIKLLQEVAKDDFKDDYCFICVILSYGKDGVITCVDDSQDRNSCPKTPTPSMMLPVSELQECLKGDKCRGLLMKPKIFLLQLESVPGDTRDAPKGGLEQLTKQLKIPREADFLIYNCETDYAIEAWKQGLKNHVQDKEEPLEIQRLLTRMNNMVRAYYEGQHMGDVELPCVTSLLTKEVYLGKRIQQ